MFSQYPGVAPREDYRLLVEIKLFDSSQMDSMFEKHSLMHIAKKQVSIDRVLKNIGKDFERR